MQHAIGMHEKYVVLVLVSGIFEMLTEQQMANLAVPLCVSGI